MGRKHSELEKKLNELRNENVSYYKKVKNALTFIDEADLHSPIALTTFPKLLQHLRICNNYTYHMISEKLGTSHTMLEKIEKIPKNSTEIKRAVGINLWYLEAFSLLYQVSPLYLIGKTDKTGQYEIDGLIDPFFEIEPQTNNKARMIIVNLGFSREGVNLLYDFVKVSDAKHEWRNKIKEMLRLLTIAKHLQSVDTTIYDEEGWNTVLCSKKLSRQDCLTCFSLLCNLGVFDPELLDIMLRLSCEAEIFSVLHQWLNDGGFLSKSYAFSKNVEISKAPQVAMNCVNVSIINNSFCNEDISRELGRTELI